MNSKIKKLGKNAVLAILSQVPIASAFSKFFEDFVQDNWQERIDLWKKEVVKQLSKLDSNFEQKIRDASNFASILASAQKGALEDIEEDKVTLYANVVINAIKNEKLDDAKKHIFLNILRDCTLFHIEVLKDISKSKGQKVFPAYGGFTVENPLVDELRRKYEDKDMLEAILKNLSEYHLTYTSLNKMGQTQPTTITNLGKEFLAFIEE